MRSAKRFSGIRCFSAASARAQQRILDAARRKDTDGILAVVSTDLGSFETLTGLTALHRIAAVSGGRFSSAPAFQQLLKFLDEAATNTWRPADVANCCWSLAALRVRDHSLVSKVLIMCSEPDEFDPRETAETLAGVVRLGAGTELVERLAGHLLTIGLEGTNAVMRSNAVWALATARAQHGLVLQATDVRLLPWDARPASPQALVMFAWALVSQRGSKAESQLLELGRVSVPRLGEFSARDLASVAWAAAKVVPGEEETTDLVARAASLFPMSGSRGQDCANITWAAASASCFTDVDLLRVRKSIQELHKFKPQELAALAWAMATASQEAPDVFAAVERVAGDALRKGSGFDVATLVWSFAKVSAVSPTVMQLANDRLLRVADFDTRGMANAVWAIASVDMARLDALEAVGQRLRRESDSLDHVESTMLLVSFVRAQYVQPDLMGLLGGNVAVPQASPQHLVNTAWAFAKAGLVDDVLFSHIAEKLEVRTREMEPQHACNVLWAFVSVGQPLGRMTGPLLSHIQSMLPTMNATDIQAVAWGLACGQLASDSLRNDILAILHQKSPADFEVVGQRQIGQWLAVEVDDESVIPEAWRRWLAAASRPADGVRPSFVQLNLQRAVQKLLPRPLQNTPVFSEMLLGGLWMVDVAFPELRAALEIDGEQHYVRELSTMSKRELGSMALKRRHLERLEWVVIRLDVADVEKHKTKAARNEFLRLSVIAPLEARARALGRM
mmetsp:Transcript_93473/g.250406  ORF Transcript_93473/g.250406 Transcript_93473/m.250406 type:complete len:734 (-) Transcript_93473:65-2266(-)